MRSRSRRSTSAEASERRSSSSRRAASRFSTQGWDGKRTRESAAGCRPSTSASSDALGYRSPLEFERLHEAEKNE